MEDPHLLLKSRLECHSNIKNAFYSPSADIVIPDHVRSITTGCTCTRCRLVCSQPWSTATQSRSRPLRMAYTESTVAEFRDSLPWTAEGPRGLYARILQELETRPNDPHSPAAFIFNTLASRAHAIACRKQRGTRDPRDGAIDVDMGILMSTARLNQPASSKDKKVLQMCLVSTRKMTVISYLRAFDQYVTALSDALWCLGVPLIAVRKEIRKDILALRDDDDAPRDSFLCMLVPYNLDFDVGVVASDSGRVQTAAVPGLCAGLNMFRVSEKVPVLDRDEVVPDGNLELERRWKERFEENARYLATNARGSSMWDDGLSFALRTHQNTQ